MLDKFINPTVFIISFIIAIFIVYLLHPEPIKVFKFPTPENTDKYTYQDDTNNCYKYEASEVKCPIDPDLILEHPLIIK